MPSNVKDNNNTNNYDVRGAGAVGIEPSRKVYQNSEPRIPVPVHTHQHQETGTTISSTALVAAIDASEQPPNVQNVVVDCSPCQDDHNNACDCSGTNDLVLFLVLTYIQRDVNNLQDFLHQKKRELLLLDELTEHHKHIASLLKEIYNDLKWASHLRSSITTAASQAEGHINSEDDTISSIIRTHSEEEAMVVRDARIQYESALEEHFNAQKQHCKIAQNLSDYHIETRIKELKETINTLQQLVLLRSKDK